MIEAHILDAWTLRSERDSFAFAGLNLLGGFAAPLFLWLAGLSLVLAAEQRQSALGSRAAASRALVRRGLEIFALAFLFRLQAFIVSPGNPLVSLLRVDILNIMGPSLVVAALLWRAGRGPHGAAVLCAAFAALLALVTPIARAATWVGSLPPPLPWYISPSGNHSTFILFPWAGFVFAGAAVGGVLAGVDRQSEGRALARLALAGAALAVGCYIASTRPSIYADSSFWTTSPTYFGLRAGVLLMLVPGFFALIPVSERAGRPFTILARFGRHSLFVYWIHVELVYGYATMLVHHRLPLWGTGLGFVAFATLMYWAIALKIAVVRWWGERPSGGHTTPALGT
jgi:uncharacterized membrane protein